MFNSKSLVVLTALFSGNIFALRAPLRPSYSAPVEKTMSKESKVESDISYLKSQLNELKNYLYVGSLNSDMVKNRTKRVREIDSKIIVLENKVKKIQNVPGAQNSKESQNEVKRIEKEIFVLKEEKYSILNRGGSKSEEYIPSKRNPVAIEGLVEVETSQTKAFDQSITSGVDLSALEIGADIHASHYLSGFVYVEKQESPSGGLEVTEGFVRIGHLEDNHIQFLAGKMLLPFGRFETLFVTDPLTLSMAETYKNALQLHAEWKGLYAQAYLFKGSTKKVGRDDRLRQHGLRVGYFNNIDDFTFDINIDYLSNMADTDTMVFSVSNVQMEKEVSGYASNFLMSYKNFSFIFEYIFASRFNTTDLPWSSGGAKPSTRSFELSYTLPLKNETTIGVGYQSSSESILLGLAKKRTIVGASTLLNEYMTLGLEYYLDKDYLASECSGTICGTGQKSYTVLANLALTF